MESTVLALPALLSQLLLLLLIPVPAVSSTTGGESLIGRSSTEFGVDLYREVIEDPAVKNVFVSPVSISLALSMVLLGAKGNTADQMIEALKFSSYKPDIHTNAKKFLDIINATDKTYQLSSANRLYGRKGYDFKSDFLSGTGEYYEASLERLDFSQAEARQTINTWVEQQTNQKIQNLIPAGVLDATTVLVLVNAIYFKGDWVYQFNTEKTIDAPFYTLSGNQLTTKMMRFMSEDLTETNFNYTNNADLNAQVLEVPYNGWDVNMYIFLPKTQDGLTQLEAKLTAEKVDDIIDNQLSSTKLGEIHIPKFKMEYHAEMIPFLQKLGIQYLFGNADLSGIGGSKGDLAVTNVIHKTFVDVNEKGTEAAAATAVVIAESGAVQAPITFRADHPFLFLIRQRSTRATLFMGRLLEAPSDGYSKSGFKGANSTDTKGPGGSNGSSGAPKIMFNAVILFLAILLFNCVKY